MRAKRIRWYPVTSEDASIDKAMSSIGTAWGGLDVLVHCIAYADRDDLNRPFTEISRQGYRMAMEISAYSLNAIARGAAPLMRERGGGSITALTYNAVERAVPGYSAMAPAKAALETGVKYLAVELGPSKSASMRSLRTDTHALGQRRQGHHRSPSLDRRGRAAAREHHH
jgi:enoyl-[acyl-carrier-protein] reductase (NADH)